MSTNYGFDEQLISGEKYERELDEYFSQWFDIQSVSMTTQKSGIDRYWTNKLSGLRYSVEYKSDEAAARWGNAFIETVSVDTENKPGWAYTSCAQILIYYVPPWNKAYCTTMVTIKSHLGEWSNTYSTGKAPNDGYNTIGLKVPFDVFEKYCYKIYTVKRNGSA